jgi:hypothetical protein
VTTHEHNRLSTEDLLNASPDSREHDTPEHDDLEHDDVRADIDDEGMPRHAEATRLDQEPELDRGSEVDSDTDLDREPELDRNSGLAPDEELAPDGGITKDTQASPAGGAGDVAPVSTAVPSGEANGKPMAPARNQPSDQAVPLFDTTEVDQFRTQWKDIQSTFVDSPQDAVREADELVAEIIQNLAATFAEHKRTLEGQWSRGDEVQTEDLRLALRQYRSFFNQLLSV